MEKNKTTNAFFGQWFDSFSPVSICSRRTRRFQILCRRRGIKSISNSDEKVTKFCAVSWTDKSEIPIWSKMISKCPFSLIALNSKWSSIIQNLTLADWFRNVMKMWVCRSCIVTISVMICGYSDVIESLVPITEFDHLCSALKRIHFSANHFRRANYAFLVVFISVVQCKWHAGVLNGVSIHKIEPNVFRSLWINTIQYTIWMLPLINRFILLAFIDCWKRKITKKKKKQTTQSKARLAHNEQLSHSVCARSSRFLDCMRDSRNSKARRKK